MKLPKVYDPSQYESDIYALWEKSQAFVPSGKGDSYSIVLPPPNANGNLHLGHALTIAVEDIAIRYHRQKGENVLFVPGADHAGFETQVVYEKELARQGKSRFDFPREQLYQQIWDFVQLNRDNFEAQIRRLGASVDWTHYTFTLDNKIVRQAYSTFKKMWDEGLIYRGERLVNFCTFHGTAFADIEVAFQEVKGSLWHIRYPLTDGSGEVVVATTRPETMLGDTAVAVNPKDKRYVGLVGKTVKLPLTNREIPILADEFVDMTFGTGAVKVTPAHDPNDYEVGKRHDLPFITVINHEGKLSSDVPEAYRGLSVEDGRQKVVQELEEQGFLVKTEDYTHSVGHCYKCGTVIQPLLREQWFVDMQPLAKEAIKALEANKIKFYPDSKRRQLITYLENLRDWNISRQIAWGIPIPAFQNIDEPEDWIYDERVDQEIITIGDKTYRRDPDVFDTWFSSSSWPYATLNYPDGEDYKQFYPLSLMETGFDILMPWVSRMLMLGLYVTSEVPFKAVYLHGLILDQHGQKMSKSKGNVVDPMEVLDKYGSDAMRMGVISGQTPGNNQPFDYTKVVGARNFANKLWNIARYIEDALGEQTGRDLSAAASEAKPVTAADHWILSKLQHSQDVVTSHLESYRFNEAYETLYHFVWDDLADWYVEASKAQPNKPLLAFLLEAVLVLAHPFAPFVTETIWQTLAWEKDTLLATKTLLKIPASDTKQAQAFAEIQNIISEVRFIVKALNVSGVTLYYTDVAFLQDNAALIKRLAKLQDVTEVQDGTGLYLTTTKYRCWLDIDAATAQAYLKEIEAKQAKQKAVIAQLEARLTNKGYIQNAPKQLIEETKSQLEAAKDLSAKMDAEYERFSGSSR
ncbi:MAG TPA: valine--tRNA ligase [Candidatus Saccharimonadales bacterium]|nr:valine--tRNA ligase [Candidatus Saccharimonadales bacterium]